VGEGDGVGEGLEEGEGESIVSQITPELVTRLIVIIGLLQYIAVQCIGYCSAVQCSAVQCSAVQWTGPQTRHPISQCSHGSLLLRPGSHTFRLRRKIRNKWNFKLLRDHELVTVPLDLWTFRPFWNFGPFGHQANM
jgi:hypothetical protein